MFQNILEDHFKNISATPEILLKAVTVHVLFNLVRLALSGTSENLFFRLRSSLIGQLTGFTFLALVGFNDHFTLYKFFYTAVLTWFCGSVTLFLYLGFKWKFIYEVSLALFAYGEYVQFFAILSWVYYPFGEETWVVVMLVIQLAVFWRKGHQPKQQEIIPVSEKSPA